VPAATGHGPRRTATLRRVVAACTLLVIAALYVGPVQKYLRVTGQVQEQRAQIESLERRQDHLIDRQQQLEARAGIVVLARECGWVFPGERPLVVRGVPNRRGGQCG
jgi:cell division protein FtsB